MFDLIIKDGFVIDGTGSSWFKGDVGVKDGKIQAVEPCGLIKANRIINARGMVVCPGFVDIHAHSELGYLEYPRAESKIRQGVTTELNCNCGESWTGPLKGSALEATKERSGDTPDWIDLDGYIQRLGKQGVSMNCAFQVGLGTVRLGVMGYANREPNKDEFDEMKEMIAQTMEQGAFGLSTGLNYVPQAFTTTDEVIEFAKVAAGYGGIYTTHRRRRGFEWGRFPGARPVPDPSFIIPYRDSPAESIREAIEIGEKAGISVEINHYKLAGKAVWGKIGALLETIEVARRRGINVNVDTCYSYNAQGVSMAYLPAWAKAENGEKGLVERLRTDPEFRSRLRREVKDFTEGFNAEVTWDDTVILGVTLEKNEDLIGKSAVEAAKLRGKDPCDLYFDLLVEGEAIQAISFSMNEEDLIGLIRHPFTIFSSDTWATEAAETATKLTHPRQYAVFPRFLRKFAIEKGVIPLEEAVRKMTSSPAAKMNLMDRGLIRPGMWADITVFDPVHLNERATFENPLQSPDGIPYVIVNGVVTIDEGEHTGALAGKVLRHVSRE